MLEKFLNYILNYSLDARGFLTLQHYYLKRREGRRERESEREKEMLILHIPEVENRDQLFF